MYHTDGLHLILMLTPPLLFLWPQVFKLQSLLSSKEKNRLKTKLNFVIRLLHRWKSYRPSTNKRWRMRSGGKEVRTSSKDSGWICKKLLCHPWTLCSYIIACWIWIRSKPLGLFAQSSSFSLCSSTAVVSSPTYPHTSHLSTLISNSS